MKQTSSNLTLDLTQAHVRSYRYTALLLRIGDTKQEWCCKEWILQGHTNPGEVDNTFVLQWADHFPLLQTDGLHCSCFANANVSISSPTKVKLP